MYERFCKALPTCYPLTLNWLKIIFQCSSVMLGWSSRHNLPTNLIINCSKNATFTKSSILNHARNFKEDPIHFVIKSYLEALNGINGIEEITCTEQENQSILGIDPRWAQRSPHNGQGWICNYGPDTTWRQQSNNSNLSTDITTHQFSTRSNNMTIPIQHQSNN